MKRMAVFLYFWWFMALTSQGLGGWVAATHGPFPTKGSCETFKKWLADTSRVEVQVSECWNDSGGPSK